MTHDTKQDERTVFIANFGRDKFNWSQCLERDVICGMMRLGCYEYFINNDSDGFVKHCITSEKTADGRVPSPTTARVWYNRNKEVEASSEEYWIHREDDKIWWTMTLNKEAFFEQSTNSSGESRWICYKPCIPWSCRDKNGKPLRYVDLHPTIKHAVVSRTSHNKADKHATYLRALIHGKDLSEWHSLKSWKQKENNTNRKSGKISDSLEKTACRIADTVFNTVKNSFGQTVERILKNKECQFETKESLIKFILELYNLQDGRCAITAIPMELDDSFTNKEFKVSLDRIDSNGHYEQHNLQLLCAFVNRWKSNDDNDNFKKLIDRLQKRGD